MMLKPLSGAPFKWHPGHVPYLPYPRYATAFQMVSVKVFEIAANQNALLLQTAM
jgi:hypothetical protein